jgi:hypothetical protein
MTAASAKREMNAPLATDMFFMGDLPEPNTLPLAPLCVALMCKGS